MVCRPVRGDNLRALASTLSPDNANGLFPRIDRQTMVLLVYNTLSTDLSQYEIFHAEAGNFWKVWYTCE